MDTGDDVEPVDLDPLVGRGAKGGVEDGAVLGHVDPLAGEHRVTPRLHARGARERDQQGHRVVGDAVLGVVEIEAGALGGQARGASGVLREQVAEVAAL